MRRDGKSGSDSGSASKQVLHGRDAELEAVAGALADEKAVLVVGEPGIGKTALLRAAALARGRPAFEGGGLAPLSWMSYLALTRALRRELPDADPVATASKVAQAVGGATLIIDDLQWIDDQTIGVLEALSGHIALLAALRSGSSTDQLRVRLVRIGFRLIELAELAPPAAAALVRGRRPDLRDAALEEVIAHARGNPFLLEELALGPGDSPSLRLTLGARLRDLSAGATEALQRLALLERPADASLLGGHATELLDSAIVTQTAEGFVLRHALLAEAALAELDDPARRALHAELADWLPSAGESARHHHAAGNRAAARERALEAAVSSARPIERARHLGIAALNAEDYDDALRIRAATALNRAGDFRLAAEVAAEIRGEQPAVRAEAELLLSQASRRLRDIDAAWRHVERGLELVGGVGGRLEGRLLIERARLHSYSWSAAALEDARRGFALLSSNGGPDPESMSVLAVALYVDGSPECLPAFRAAHEAAQLAEDPAVAAEALGWEIGAHQAFGDPATALELARAAETRVGAFGDGPAVRGLRWVQAHVELFCAGDYGRSRELHEALLENPVALGEVVDRVRPNYALTLADLGRDVDADAALRRMESSTASDDGRELAMYVRAEIEWLAGRSRGAAECARSALEAYPCGGFTMALQAVLAWACLDLGEPVAGPTTTAIRLPASHGWITQVRAIEALARPRGAAEAERLFDDAADQLAGVSVRDELRCRWGAGEAAARAGALDRARERLADVERRAAARDLEPLLARIRRSLRQAGARRTVSSSPAYGRLTPREREVLALVARGHTSAQIATRLGVERSTVESQVGSAMRKLGARSRAQAAAMAGDEARH